MVPSLINALRRQIEELEREVADLTRQNEQLREAVRALLAPATVKKSDSFS
jgi:FtsZ-binding cell division protein ZapB